MNIVSQMLLSQSYVNDPNLQSEMTIPYLYALVIYGVHVNTMQHNSDGHTSSIV